MRTFSSGTESEALAVIGGQHGKSVDGLFKKVTFQTAFEVSKVGKSLKLRGSPFRTVGAK